ncbi:hypothetical protein AB0B45_05070 [Nonomuraea sp. NPDC049152]|uniref:hypothetical protein n=1 Tax=Nonomuraea sp. NPDC049152 TaxID=3154350 RepID=UPI0033F5B1C8
MARRLSSRAVALGAVVTVSSVVLAGCATGGSTYAGSEQVVMDSFEEGDTSTDEDLLEEEEDEDEVVARCVRRDSEDDGRYVIVDDDRCDSAGRHGAYLWYYGGTKVRNRVSKGTTSRPRDSLVVTKSGDEITRAGKISTNGFGNRTSTGS